MTYDPEARHAIREWDEVYLQVAGKNLSARIYQPVEAGPFPAIIDVHGGDWSHLDRRSDFYPCRQLAQSGIVVIAIDFRLAPEFKYPASLQDTNFAVRWAKHNAKRLKIIPEWVGGFGSSTGAQMITLTALRPMDTLLAALPLPGAPESPGDESPEEENLDASLAFVLAPDPIFDVTARYEHAARQPGIAARVDDSDYPRLRTPLPVLASTIRNGAGRPLALWNSLRGLPLPGYAKFEHWFEDKLQSIPMRYSMQRATRNMLMTGVVEGHENYFAVYEEMADASPLSVLSAGSAQRYPPVFAVQSSGNVDITLESSLAFVSAYLRVGGRIEYSQASGVGHGFVNIPSHQADAAIAGMKKFIQGVFLRNRQDQ